jgi:CRP/FNR family transcriptional regulator, cyclic AMP receptor protein
MSPAKQLTETKEGNEMGVTAIAASPHYARLRLGFGASTFFGELPADSLDRLAAVATLQRFDEGGPVHELATKAERFWLVLTGAIRVSWIAPGRKPPTIAIVGEGSFYSVGALVEGALLRTEGRAERGTVTGVIQGDDLRAVQEVDPAVRALIPRIMLARFHAVISLYVDLISAPLPQRLARRLMSQAITSGKHLTGGSVELRTSQTDLAEMLGASRPKVNAVLRELERAEMLRLGYRRIHVLDVRRMCELAGPEVLPL